MVIGNSRNRLIKVLRARGSSPAEGSSKTNICGFMDNTVAMIMRFFSPTRRGEDRQRPARKVQVTDDDVLSMQVEEFRKECQGVAGSPDSIQTSQDHPPCRGLDLYTSWYEYLVSFLHEENRHLAFRSTLCCRSKERSAQYRWCRTQGTSIRSSVDRLGSPAFHSSPCSWVLGRLVHW